MNDPLASGLDPNLAEATAQQLNSASLSSYGVLPNPQLSWEAIQSGASRQVLGAFQTGDPAYRALLTGTPAGQAPAAAQQPAAVAPPPTDPSLYQVDWKQFWGQNQQRLGDGVNSSWKSFGEVPIQNFAYMDAVRSQKNPDRIKAWQRMLGKQVPQSEAPGVTGIWDDKTEAAFRGMMISQALPDALYAKDAAGRDRARLFLSGLGVDVASLESAGRSDPTFQRSVVERWMAAQGPDATIGDKSQLQGFADKYGVENLPQQWQSLAQDNFLDWLRNGISHALPVATGILGGILGSVGGPLGAAAGAAIGGTLGGFLDKAPGVDRAVNVVANTLTGNVFQHPGDITLSPAQIKANGIYAQLSKDEQAVLAPALQDTVNNTGFMGIFDAYDRVRTKAILSLSYAFGDAIAGKGWENPFDPNSAAGRGAEAHQDNLIAGLAPGFAHDHPTLATIANFAANVADDPISWLPVAKRGTAAAGRSIRSYMGTDSRAAIDEVLSDLPQLHRDTLAALRGIGQNPDSHGLIDGLTMLGEHTSGDLAWERVGQVRRIMQGENLGEASDLLHQEFQHGMLELKSWANRSTALKALGPEVMKRVSASRVGAMRVIGSFGAGDTRMAVLDDPRGTVEKFQQAAVAAGMDSAAIRKAADAYLNSTGQWERFTNAQKMGQALAQHLKQQLGDQYDAFLEWVKKARSGQGFLRQYDDSKDVSLHRYATDPFGDIRAPLEEEQQVELSNLQKALDVKQSQIEENKALLSELFGDESAAAYEQHGDVKAQIDQQVKEAEQIQAEIDRMTRPAPVTPSQFGQTVKLPFTPYEIASFLNPVLRRSEQVQHSVHADAWMSTWRNAVLSRPSTIMRIDLGDDAMRAPVKLALDGHPMAAVKLIASMARKTALSLTPGRRGEVARQQAIDNLGRQAQDDSMRAHALADQDAFVPYHPEHRGYIESLRHVVRNQWSRDDAMRTWAKAFEQGGEPAAHDALRTWADGESPDAAELRRIRGLEPGSDELTRFVARLHDMYSGQMQLPEVRQSVIDGSFNSKTYEALLKDSANHRKLPIVLARRRSAYSDNVVLRGLKGYHNWLWEHMTRPMINAARSEMLVAIRERYVRNLQSVYGDAWDDRKIQQVADGWARNWLQANTYQGTRSIAGQALRNVFPFWGATANMNRFWLRQAMDKPFVGDAVLRGAASLEQQQANPQQHMTGFQGLLAHIGFTGGTALEFNPAHMLFITSDGVGSMVPGFGPIFTPLLDVIAQDQHLAQVLSGVPGLGEQLGYASGQGRAPFPFLADITSGAATAIAGRDVQIPFIGRSQEQIQRREDEIIRQRKAAGQTVTAADEASIAREAGAGMFLQGALGFLLPVQPQVVDGTGRDIQQLVAKWDQAPDEATKDALIAGQLGMPVQDWQAALADGSFLGLLQQDPTSPAALLIARDSRLNAQQRGEVGVIAPWVTSYNTSMYESADQTPATLQQWRWSKAQGNIHLLSPDEYLTRIGTQSQVNNGWVAYDNIRQQEFAFLQQNGVTTSSPEYKAFKAQTLDPATTALEQQYPAWAQKFGSSTRRDLPGLVESTSPLRTLQTWEVIPQTHDKETRQSSLWRQALVWRDEAAHALVEVRTRTHTQAEVDAIMQGLQDRLASLAQEDPSFATQLSRYSFGRWQDIVTLEAMQIQAQQTAA